MANWIGVRIPERKFHAYLAGFLNAGSDVTFFA
jgi:hypothetical protein